MTIEENKKLLYDHIAQLEEEIEILKGNIVDYKQILENIHTEKDIEKHNDFDIEKGLNIIELFWKRGVIRCVQAIAKVHRLYQRYGCWRRNERSWSIQLWRIGKL